MNPAGCVGKKRKKRRAPTIDKFPVYDVKPNIITPTKASDIRYSNARAIMHIADPG